jgi:phosphatidylglycerophosphate synthase
LPASALHATVTEEILLEAPVSHTRFITIPNGLSFIRLVFGVVIPVLAALKAVPLKEIDAMAIIVALTDFFDGFAARVLGQESQFGVKLDALADKVFCAGLFATIFILFARGPWSQFLILLVVMGAGFVAYGVFTTLKRVSGALLHASLTAKAKTVAMMVGLIMILLDDPMNPGWKFQTGLLILGGALYLTWRAYVDYIAHIEKERVKAIKPSNCARG